MRPTRVYNRNTLYCTNTSITLCLAGLVRFGHTFVSTWRASRRGVPVVCTGIARWCMLRQVVGHYERRGPPAILEWSWCAFVDLLRVFWHGLGAYASTCDVLSHVQLVLVTCVEYFVYMKAQYDSKEFSWCCVWASMNVSFCICVCTECRTHSPH